MLGSWEEFSKSYHFQNKLSCGRVGGIQETQLYLFAATVRAWTSKGVCVGSRWQDLFLRGFWWIFDADLIYCIWSAESSYFPVLLTCAEWTWRSESVFEISARTKSFQRRCKSQSWVFSRWGPGFSNNCAKQWSVAKWRYLGWFSRNLCNCRVVFFGINQHLHSISSFWILLVWMNTGIARICQM